MGVLTPEQAKQTEIYRKNPAWRLLIDAAVEQNAIIIEDEYAPSWVVKCKEEND